VGFEAEADESQGASYSRGTPRRKMNGAGQSDVHAATPRFKLMPVSAGLSLPSRPRPSLADEDLERMLDRVVAEDGSDSEGEILIPPPRVRRDGAQVVGA